MATTKEVLAAQWSISDKHLNALRRQLNYLDMNINQLQSQRESLQREVDEITEQTNGYRDQYFNAAQAEKDADAPVIAQVEEGGHYQFLTAQRDVIADEIESYDDALGIAQRDGYTTVRCGPYIIDLKQGKWVTREERE